MLEFLLDPDDLNNKHLYSIISKMTAHNIDERWDTEDVITEVKKLEKLFSDKNTSPVKKKGREDMFRSQISVGSY